MIDMNKYLKICETYLDEFKNKVLPMDYLNYCITIMEGFSFCMMAKYFDINMIIESGTAEGMSTEIWGRYFDFPIFSIDSTEYYGQELFNNTKERLSRYPNIKCLKGDSNIIMPDIISKNTNNKIALFLDGPKSGKAVILGEKCFKYPNVPFLGIHDACSKNSWYHYLDCWEKTFLYSDNSCFDKYLNLDKDIEQRGIAFAINN